MLIGTLFYYHLCIVIKMYGFFLMHVSRATKKKRVKIATSPFMERIPGFHQAVVGLGNLEEGRGVARISEGRWVIY